MLMVREGSIHFASQRLSIAPSLITTSICALENELGFNLITRGRNIRKVILTEKGHAFYRLAPDLLRLLNAIADIRAGIKQQDVPAGCNNQFRPRKYWAILK